MCNNAFLLGKTMEQFVKTAPPANHGLIANELVSVQPLPMPIGKLYYLNYQYPRYTLLPDGTIVLKTKRNRKPKLIILWD